MITENTRQKGGWCSGAHFGPSYSGWIRRKAQAQEFEAGWQRVQFCLNFLFINEQMDGRWNGTLKGLN